MIDERYILMIHKHLRDELSAADRLVFREWLEQDPAHRLLLSDMEKAWQLSKNYQADFTPDVENGLQALQERIRAEKPALIRRLPRSKRKSISFSYAVAASLLLLISSLAAWNLWFRPADMLTVSTTLGEQKTIPLSDGSTVVLNENSSLTYPSHFRGGRQVGLSGEAYFDIESNPDEIFTITTAKAKTEVLGTIFNLRAYDNELFTEVEVIEGRVRLADIDGTTPLELTQGTRGTYEHQSDTLLADVPKTLNSVYWKERRLIFDGHEVLEAIEEVESRLGIEITMTDTLIARCLLTLSIPLDHPDFIVSKITGPFDGAVWNKTAEGKYTITGGDSGCQ